jgi:hypothetical protein
MVQTGSTEFSSMESEFHLGLLKVFWESWAMTTLPSGLEEIIADDEDLARYLTSSSQFNAVMVKPAAFLPNQ